MRALVQRVTAARVEVEGAVVGEIAAGLCVFVGVTHDDDEVAARRLAEQIWNLRVFDDEQRMMNRSAADVGGEGLVVSQFTLYGDTARGRRPSWAAAARPDVAEPLVGAVIDGLERLGATVAAGRFRAHMHVTLTNDGPVTLMIDTT